MGCNIDRGNSEVKSERNAKRKEQWAKYAHEFVMNQRSHETKRAYQRELKSFLELVYEKENIQYIPQNIPRLITAFLSDIKKEDPHTKHVTNARTLNRRLATITSFFRYLLSQGHISRMPALPKPYPLEKKSTTPSPTREECIALLNYLHAYKSRGIKQERNTIYFLFLFFLALRKSEAINLRWNNIDFHKKTLTLIQKGGTKKILPVPPVLDHLLKTYREHLATRGLLIPSLSSSLEIYLFPCLRKGTEKPISSSTGYFIICSLVKKVLPNKTLTPHSFRKAFIEQSLDRKSDLISIANATGHASIEMIKYYDTRDSLRNNAVHDLVSLLKWEEKSER